VTGNYFDETRATSFNFVVLARPFFPSEARRSTLCDSKCPCDVGILHTSLCQAPPSRRLEPVRKWTPLPPLFRLAMRREPAPLPQIAGMFGQQNPL
jgi:hypothetical protein